MLHFNPKEENEFGITPDLTPLIDVIFLLLIFFMLTTTFIQQDNLKINLPKAKAVEKNIKDTNLIKIIIDADSHIWMDGVKVLGDDDKNSIVEKLTELSGKLEDPTVVIAADASVIYQRIIDVFQVVASFKITKIRLTTESTEKK